MRTPGLDSALSALRYWRAKNEIVANNLANVSSQGFKGQRVFAELLPGNQPGVGAALDLSPGPLLETGRPLDLVVEGEGFFVVESANGERLTRRGAFEVDRYGFLVDPAGNLVLGEGGPIALPPSDAILIDHTGDVYVDGELVDRLRIERPELDAGLTPEGAALLRVDGRTEPVIPDFRNIRQGFLEESNVEALEGMTELITIQRAYAAVQRAIETLDGVAGTVANDLARVG